MLPTKSNVDERHIWRLTSVFVVDATGCIMVYIWGSCVSCDCKFRIFTYLFMPFCFKLVSSCERNVLFKPFSNRRLYTDNIVNTSSHKNPYIPLIRAVTLTLSCKLNSLWNVKPGIKCKLRFDKVGQRNNPSLDCFPSIFFHFGSQSLTFYTWSLTLMFVERCARGEFSAFRYIVKLCENNEIGTSLIRNL